MKRRETSNNSGKFLRYSIGEGSEKVSLGSRGEERPCWSTPHCVSDGVELQRGEKKGDVAVDGGEREKEKMVRREPE